MAVRRIARLGEPGLRRVASKIEAEQFGSAGLQALVNDLIETMRAVSGAGLAAPQIFENVAVCVIEVKKNTRYPMFPEIPLSVLVNPVLTPLPGHHGSIAIFEGCLSVPGLRGRVVRPRAVQLSALTPTGEPIERQVIGVEAAILQHEVDHLLGSLFVDKADPRSLTFLEEFEQFVPVEERVTEQL